MSGESSIMAWHGRKNKLRGKRKFMVNLRDVITVLCNLAFLFYLSILIRDDVGLFWLNVALLAVTAVFAIAFIIKIFAFNKYAASEDQSLKMRRIYKFLTFCFKLFLFGVIVVGLTSTIMEGQFSIELIITTIIANLLFLILFIWDAMKVYKIIAKKP